MLGFKLFLTVGLSVAAIALGGLYFKNVESTENKWLDVVVECRSNPKQEYSDYCDEREDGIGMLKMKVKLIPNIDSSKESYLIAYKAEIALNPQAINLPEQERPSDFFQLWGERYGVDLCFSLLDEDGFRLDLLSTKGYKTTLFHTSNFFELMADGKPQVEQAIITSYEISPTLAKRIKKVRIVPDLTKYKEES